jgi:hypothetical protein
VTGENLAGDAVRPCGGDGVRTRRFDAYAASSTAERDGHEPRRDASRAPRGAARHAAGCTADFVDGIRALAALFVVLHHVYITVYDGFPPTRGRRSSAPALRPLRRCRLHRRLRGSPLGLAPAAGLEPDRRLLDVHATARRRIIPPYGGSGRLGGAGGGAGHPHPRCRLVEGRRPTSSGAGPRRGASPNGAFWSIAVEGSSTGCSPCCCW